MKCRTHLAWIAVALLALTVPAREGSAQETPKPLPPDATDYGLTMSEWAVAWFEWAMPIPQNCSPDLAFDKTGLRGSVGQHGPVWFLPGYLGGGSVTRNYIIPEGKAILLHLGASVELDTPGKRTDEQLIADLKKNSIQTTVSREVSLDGVAIPDVNRFLFTTPVFSVVFPPGNPFGVPVTNGKDHRLAVAAQGYQMIFPPLPVGNHVFFVRFQGTDPQTSGTFKDEWTFNVTIQKANAPLP
jgi:hypothetical protein